MGVILFAMIIGCYPFKEASKSDYFYSKIRRGKWTDFWRIVTPENLDIDDDFKNLIQSMLAPKASDRLSFAKILSHQWTNGYVATLSEVQKEVVIS